MDQGVEGGGAPGCSCGNGISPEKESMAMAEMVEGLGCTTTMKRWRQCVRGDGGLGKGLGLG